MHRYLSSIASRRHRQMPFQRRKEQQFIGRLNGGQPDAWIQLINRWSPHLYSYIFYNVNNEEATRQLMHLILSDVIQTVIRSPRTISLTVLIFSIAYRHILRYCADHPLATSPKPHKVQAVNNVQTGPQAAPTFIQKFRRFSLETQQILLLRYVCHVPLAELSQIVDQSEDILAQKLYRAKLYLQ